jgi:aldose sugar dehydrogenase
MFVCSLCSIAFIACLIQYNGRSQIAFSSAQQNKVIPQTINTSAKLVDPGLKLEIYASGLSGPTNIAFLDSGEILVLEKNTGLVKKIVNGTIQKEPLLDENVATFDTRGMLGITVTKNATTGKENVFLYFTEAANGKGDAQDRCFEPPRCDPNNLPNGNRLYRYEMSANGSKLINKKLIFSWPPFTGATHNGGEMIVGPDKNIYLIVGDGEKKTIMSNGKDSIIDGRAGILAFDQSGKAAYKNGIIGSEDPLNKYYAYGIRNGFGLDFDPISGKLWDTENGPGFGDELNLVEPGFNSGHNAVDGFWERINYSEGKYVKEPDPSKLETFGGKGKYSSPEFAWYKTVGVSALKFLNTDKYGSRYKDNLLVATIVPNGDIYDFDLSKNRSSLNLPGLLKDKIVDNYTELSPVMFGSNFGGISDLSVGPDGYLYVVSFGEGRIYRVVPTDSKLLT